ncbi:MAG: acylphosphatase [Chloroflexota bacterium]
MKVTVVYKVSGLVQGVGYRYFAKRAADALGLVGYAENLYSGEVEAVATGEKEKQERFYAELLRGPSHALVEKVIRREVGLREFHSFQIK